MANKFIADMTEKSVADDSDILIIQDTEETKKITFDNIFNTLKTKFSAKALTYDNTVSKLSATNTQDALDEIEGRVDVVSNSFNSMQIGVTNLIQDSDFSQFREGRGIWLKGGTSLEPGTETGFFEDSLVAEVTGRESATGRVSAAYQDAKSLGYSGRPQLVQPGETLSFGIWVNVRSAVPYVNGGSIYARFASATPGEGTKDVNMPLDGIPKDTWTYLTATVNMDIYVYFVNTAVALYNGSVEFCKPMLVRGTIAPDHMPSPQDMVSKVDLYRVNESLTSRITALETAVASLQSN